MKRCAARKRLVAGAVFGVVSGALFGGAEAADDLGALIAAGGRPGGPCLSCHGVHGMGESGTGVPRIAGLDARYLARQLADYASGARPSDVMAPIAAALKPKEREAVARYYADKILGSEREALASREAPKLVQHGAALWARGSALKGVQACVSCHGGTGRSVADSIYPSLAGQPKRYIGEQLRQFRDGRRRNDVGGVMRAVAARLEDGDIESLSAFISVLPP